MSHHCNCCHHESGSKSSCHLEHSHTENSQHDEVIKFSVSIAFFLLGFVFKFFASHINIYGVSVFIPFFIISWGISGYDVILTPIKNFRKGIIFDENFLMSIATIGAFILGDWTEAASVMLFYNLGEIAQGAIIEKARKNIINVAEFNSSFARVLKDKKQTISTEEKDYEIKEPKDVEMSSTLLVFPGEKIPLDSIVINGTSELNTSSMTGESLPRIVNVGDEVLAGFINLTGLLVLKTTAVLKDSEASKMLELIELAQERKTKTEKLITSFAKIYTPIVLLSALIISVLPPLFIHYFLIPQSSFGFSSFTSWIHRGLVFLVISCPCAFILSVPLAYFAGIGAFARNGILVKGADYIDALSKVKKIVFDKTGTLTLGKLNVTKIVSEDGVKEEELLKYATLAESSSNHPIAKAIKKALNSHSFESFETKDITDYQEKIGKGIECKFMRKPLYAGSSSFIEEKLKQDIPINEEVGSVVYVAYAGKYLGYIVLQDEIKKNAKDTIEELKRIGIKDVSMLTGDVETVAKHVSSSLMLNSYRAKLLPREKVEVFEKEAMLFREKNTDAKVLFIGDGINDAAVLSISDIGVAIGDGATAAAMEASDVVFLKDDLSLLPKSLNLAKRTRNIVKENIVISFLIKIGFLLLGSLGIVGLQLAVLADVGVALLATLNSMRLKK
ncbi:MAG: heavy metal translocating P-type ATPase [Treponema sp.]